MNRSRISVVLRSALRRFHADAYGASAIMMGLCALPMIGLVGLGIDYGQGLSHKRRLDAAADSAAIAAINGAQSYYNANVASEAEPNLTADAKAAGQSAGTKSFKVNAGGTLVAVPAVASVQVAKSGQTFTSTVSYTGPMSTSFGKLFGTPSFTIAGATGSTLTMGTYLDFHILVDVSGSMGLPTSDAGQSALAAVNPDDRDSYPNGCVFACHFPGNKGYDVAKAKGITLRVDSVASALNNLITTATKTRTLSNQFRIAVYPFIVHLMQAAALSSDFTAATTVANNLAGTYLDTGLSNSATKAMGSGGSHFDNVLPDLQPYVKTIGDGSTPQSPKTFVFIVTDGMNQSQTFDGTYWSAGGSTPGEPNFGYCQYAQSLGVVMSILYIPYVPIQNPNPNFAGNEDGKANAVIPKLPNDLSACANSGFFFTANSDADISNAMQTMFSQAIKAARLTQ